MQPCQSDVKVVPLRDSRLRLASALLGLVGLGLLLSLLPRTSFVTRPAGEIVDAVGPVWPEQSVEQVIEDVPGVVSEIRIWGAAGVGRGEAPVVAALLQGPDRELVRQERVGIKASHLQQPYVIEFAPYHPAPGEALVLQLWVSPERRNHAIFGTMEPGADRAGPTLNLNPTEQGPLAYEVIWRGEGWRAALEGSWHDRLRLAGGIVAAVAAVLLRTPVARRLTQALGRLRAAVLATGGVIAGRRTAVGAWLGVTRPPTGPEPRRRAFYIYPWLIPAFAILHFLATNLLLIRAHEAIVPSIVIMAGVAAAFITFRFILNGAAPAALFTGLLGVLFFSYGHIYIADSEQPDLRLLLGIGPPALVGIGMLLRGRVDFSHKIGRILNFGALVLVAFPIFQLGEILVTTASQPDRDTEILANQAVSDNGESRVRSSPNADDMQNDILANPVMIDASLSQKAASIDPNDLRDIYYIVLDTYPRSGSLESFDNSAFVAELEKRGFYVDPQARSNYTCTVHSIASATNMSYFKGDNPCGTSQIDHATIYNVALSHDLGRILKSLGYNYVHVSSGWTMTATSRSADLIVDFTPEGRVEWRHDEYEAYFQWHRAFERGVSMSSQFMVNFGETTLLKALWEFGDYDADPGNLYGPWHPYRAQDWLDYMKEGNPSDAPRFLFAHLLKPHEPYSFDQDGNIAFGQGWTDEHDARVASAFHGQVMWLNGRMLEVIDGILANSDRQPIIVITSDHSRADWGFATGDPTAILAAYLLPEGGEKAIYPSITSVNVFRAILDYYFSLGLGLLEDRVFVRAG